MGPDLLDGAEWFCCSTAPGAIGDPSALDKWEPEWFPATVPGTVAGALRAAGRLRDDEDLDAMDWWFRTRVPSWVEAGAHELEFDGLATIADVWWNGDRVLHSENMFRTHRVPVESSTVESSTGENELVVHFSALTSFLEERRPRPRWKTYLVAHPNLRWLRTSLLGRIPGWAAMPAPVGPFRAVRLHRRTRPHLRERHVVARLGPAGGEVEVRLEVAGVRASGDSATLRVGRDLAALSARQVGDDVVVAGTIVVPDAQLWWPHTHGPQPLYRAVLEIGDECIPLGAIGFRSIEADRADDGFRLRVNGTEIFCRGAVWMPIDPVTLTRTERELRSSLESVKEAGMNMIRLPGTGVYEDESFWDLCDELGILVWQDCMMAFYDPPDDEGFRGELTAELAGVLASLGGRPSLAVVCGGQEIESQAAMLGVPRDRWVVPLLEGPIRTLVARDAPGVPYVTSNPSGGDLPFQMDAGVCHFFGVGGYARPLSDLRRARVRFATEALAFACPGEVSAVEEEWGGSEPAGHDPRWKLGVHHDAKRAWDLEDMQSYYVHELFGADPFLARWSDPDRAQDLARATVATVMTEAMAQWRRTGSECGGALVLALRDLRAGGGWGVCDSAGRPKAPWFALRRAFQPVMLLGTDEGLNGLHLHLVNETAGTVDVVLRVSLFSQEVAIANGASRFRLEPRVTRLVEASSLFTEWWDLAQVYGFGAPAFDAIVATLEDPAGDAISEIFHFPGGRARPVEPDIGLRAELGRGEDRWTVSIATRRLAQWVVVDVPGFRPSDSWFHLAPGGMRVIDLRPLEASSTVVPVGRVRALNAVASARVGPS